MKENVRSKTLFPKARLALGALVVLTGYRLAVSRLQLRKEEAKARDLLEERIHERTTQLARSEERARELAGHVVAAQQRERTNLSYEVHDGITQVATAAYQHLQVFQAKYPNGPLLGQLTPYRAELDEAVKLSRLPVRDSRRLIEELRPTVLDDFGLPAAIRQIVQERNDQGWDIELSITMPDESYIQRCHPDAETALYRVCLEALQNIQKHARASQVWITLTIDNAETGSASGSASGTPHALLTITDNGVGFDTCRMHDHPARSEECPEGYGSLGRNIGLKSMMERVRVMDGDLHVVSSPNSGTTITAEIPVEHTKRHSEAREEGVA